jgi:hypothetical protein
MAVQDLNSITSGNLRPGPGHRKFPGNFRTNGHNPSSAIPGLQNMTFKAFNNTIVTYTFSHQTGTDKYFFHFHSRLFRQQVFI